jgi:plasmid stability protein
MATITIRDLEPAVKQRIRVLAARHGRSMEEEARAILRAAVSEPERPVRGLGTAINKRFQAIGGDDLELPPREPMREPPKFK